VKTVTIGSFVSYHYLCLSEKKKVISKASIIFLTVERPVSQSASQPTSQLID